MRTVLLYGELANLLGEEHRLSVRSASEAIQALCANFPDFRRFMSSAHTQNTGFKLSVGATTLSVNSEVVSPSSNSETIRIVPTIFGSSAGVRVFAGIGLLVAAYYTGGAAVALTAAGNPGAGAIVGVASQIMAGVGITLILGGVSELLSSPPPGVNAGPEDRNNQSYVFSGPENVSRQGGAIPVGYGRMMVGSTVVSASIEDVDQ